MKMDSKLFREQCEEMKRVCGSVASMKELKDDVTCCFSEVSILFIHLFLYYVSRAKPRSLRNELADH